MLWRPMEDAGASDGKVEAVVGTIVWVRRRNGSWWPGRIISEEELLTANLLSPRSGTPVKLLGREDGSVDWYNIEKSKRVKAFRCGDFEECIERAKALAGHSGKRREKYARREDAILDALELEKQQLACNFGLTEPSMPKESGEMSCAASKDSNMETFSGVRCAAYYQIGHLDQQSAHPVPEIAQSCRLSDRANIRPDCRWNEHKQEMEVDDKKFDSVPRMRGLQDLGLKVVGVHGKSQVTMLGNASGNRCRDSSDVTHEAESCGLEYNGVAAHWKKKRSLGDFSSKRRDRKRPLMQVLENSVKLSMTTESLSSLRAPSTEIRSCVEGYGPLHLSPRTDISEHPKSFFPDCSGALSTGINLSGCETSHAQSSVVESLDQKGFLSPVQLFSCPSIPGSYCNMCCTHHGISSSLSMGSIDKHSSNAEPHAFNKLKDMEGSAQVEVNDQLVSAGHQSPYCQKGKKSARDQKAVHLPLRPNETASANRMLRDKGVRDYEAECFGFSSKVRSKRHWKAKSQDFFSSVAQDFVPTFQSDKGNFTGDRRELINADFPSDRDDGGRFAFPFSYYANNSEWRNETLPNIPSKSNRENENSLYASNLARKSSPKMQWTAKLKSQNSKHSHSVPKEMQSSKSNPGFLRNSSTESFKYPDTIWFDIHVDSQETSQRESVPMVLMASKLNRRPIIGYPVVVEVVEPDNLRTFFQSQGAVNDVRLDEVQHFWRTGKRTSRQRGRRLSFAVAHDGQREACSSAASGHMDQSSMIAGSEDGTKCIDVHSRTSLLIPQNAETGSKQNMFNRKRRESLHKVALSKKVLRRVRLSSKKTRTRTLSSIAEEQCNRSHQLRIEHESNKFLTSLAEKSHPWMTPCQVTAGVSSSDFQQPSPKIHDTNIAPAKHLMAQRQVQEELPVVFPSTAPGSACIPVRVALERLKAAVCKDHKVCLNLSSQ